MTASIRNNGMTLFFIIICSFLLSSCSLFSVKIETPTKFILNTLPSCIKAKKRKNITLLVLIPDTQSAYNTTQMAYSPRFHQVSYFSQNEWVETPSQMFQPLLIQTLQNTHRFHAVVAQPFTGHYDYILNTQILQLQQNLLYYPAKLELTVNVQLISGVTNRVIATQLFSEQQPILQRTPYAGVIAANNATKNILQQIAIFCLNTI